MNSTPQGVPTEGNAASGLLQKIPGGELGSTEIWSLIRGRPRSMDLVKIMQLTIAENSNVIHVNFARADVAHDLALAA